MTNIKEAIRAKVERLKKENESIRCSANEEYCRGYDDAFVDLLSSIDSLPDEQQEISLEQFTEKMNSWKARFTRQEVIPIKATMAFTARMFYMYPNVARLWYYSLPKATQD